jgi:hypothetical protein
MYAFCSRIGRVLAVQEAEMFEDLRNVSTEPEALEEPQTSLVERLPLFVNLKPRERFVIALLLFLNVAVLGCACLLVFERIVP